MTKPPRGANGPSGSNAHTRRVGASGPPPAPGRKVGPPGPKGPPRGGGTNGPPPPPGASTSARAQNGKPAVVEGSKTSQQAPLSNPVRRMDTIRVSLRKIGDCTTEREQVYKLLFENNVDVRHIFPAATGFSVIADNPAAVEKILSSGLTSKLAALKLKPLPPPELLARRTIVVRGVDEMVGSHSAESIKEEINKNNTGITVESAIKIPNRSRFFKLVMANTDSADKACREGLKAFYYKIRTDQISQETFVSLKVCFKCYMYNDHATNQCRSTILICSECAQVGHSYRDCKSTVKRCVNCTREGGDPNHRTLAAKCPLRKKLINDKRSQINNKNQPKTTYANVAKNAAEPKRKSPETPTLPQIKLDSSISVKMTALIIEAHIASLTRNEMFSTYLSENMKLNYDIDVKFPERNSQEIFRMLSNPEQPMTVQPPQGSLEEPSVSGSDPAPQRGQKHMRETSSSDTEEGRNSRKRRNRKKKSAAPEGDTIIRSSEEESSEVEEVPQARAMGARPKDSGQSSLHKSSRDRSANRQVQARGGSRALGPSLSNSGLVKINQFEYHCTYDSTTPNKNRNTTKDNNTQ